MRVTEADTQMTQARTPAGARSAFYGLHSRYAIPLACPCAFRFYLDHLVLPHSLPEMVRTTLARRWPRLISVLFARRPGNSRSYKAEGEHTSTATAETQYLHREFQRRLESRSLALLTRTYAEGVRRSRTVSFLFDDSSQFPLAVAKLSPDAREASVLKHEYETLERLTRVFEGERPGFLPQPLALFQAPPWTVLLETCLPGRTANFEMRNSWRALQQAPKHFRLALEWVMSFQRTAGIKKINLSQSAATNLVMLPLQEFALQGALSASELQLIENTANLVQRLLGAQIFLVAGHGDLWSGNLVINGSSAGVIDWEQFKPETLPFDDLFSFSTAYGLNYPWKLAHRAAAETAFRATYLQATEIADLVRKILLTYCNATGLATELLEVFFPVFLAQRALEEYSYCAAEEGAGAAAIKTEAPRLRHAHSEKAAAGDMWRRFFRIYAERSEPACFIDRRKRWRRP